MDVVKRTTLDVASRCKVPLALLSLFHLYEFTAIHVQPHEQGRLPRVVIATAVSPAKKGQDSYVLGVAGDIKHLVLSSNLSSQSKQARRYPEQDTFA